MWAPSNNQTERRVGRKEGWKEACETRIYRPCYRLSHEFISTDFVVITTVIRTIGK
jgi:hypothetical protein